MDNIQKLILGVLGISGMLAMLVPSGVGVALPPTSATPTPVVGVTEAAAIEEEVPSDDEATEESEMTEEDIFMVGEPAIDGNPIQMNQSNNMPQQTEAQYVAPSFEYNQPNIASDQASAELPLPVPPPAAQ